jgi:hypothetical protein
MMYDPAIKEVVLFGGFDGRQYLNDTWAWSGSGWSELSTGLNPPGRDGASLAYVEPPGRVPLPGTGAGELVLFGGRDAAGDLGDTWVLASGAWSQVEGASPSARSGAAMAADGATAVLFGGQTTSGILADTWVFSGGSWSQASPASSPPASEGGSLVYDRGVKAMVLFGGQTASGLSSGTWTFDGSGWVELSPSVSPPARAGSAMAYDSTDDELVLFGGADTGGLLDDTWSWSEAVAPAPVPSVVAPPPAGSHLADTPSAGGYWVLGSAGQVDPHFAAAFYGSTPLLHLKLNRPPDRTQVHRPRIGWREQR